MEAVYSNGLSKGYNDGMYIMADKDNVKILERTNEAKKERKIVTWIEEHKGFMETMGYAFEIAKGEEEKFDAKFVKRMLKKAGYKVDFTAGELLKVWKKV